MPLVIGMAVLVLLRAPVGSVSGDSQIPPGLDAVGISAAALQPSGYVDRESALSEAENQGFLGDGQVAAYLVRATDATTPLIQSRDVWLLVITGVKFSGGTPMGPDGGPVEEPAIYDTLYMYIDAVSGKWILTRAIEAT